jgi:hypothetical protein
MTSSVDLRRLLERLAEAFAHGLVDAVAGTSFEGLSQLPYDEGPRASQAARNSRPAEALSADPTPPKRARSEAPPRADVLASIVAHLRGLPAGGRAEELRRDLGLDKPTFIRAINDGLATEEIRKTGHLRATTYFAA